MYIYWLAPVGEEKCMARCVIASRSIWSTLHMMHGTRREQLQMTLGGLLIISRHVRIR